MPVGDGASPSEAERTARLATGEAAMGIGNAFLVRGPYVAELTLDDPKADQAALTRVANATLPGLVGALASHIDGVEAPRAVELLPTSERLPMGVRYIEADILGVKSAGDGAYGYHKTPKGFRYRSLVASRATNDAAEKTFESLTRGGTLLAGTGDAAATVDFAQGGAKAEWIVARKGAFVVGLGDETRVLRDGMSAAEHAAVCLPIDEKKARLEATLGRLSAP